MIPIAPRRETSTSANRRRTARLTAGLGGPPQGISRRYRLDVVQPGTARLSCAEGWRIGSRVRIHTRRPPSMAASKGSLRRALRKPSRTIWFGEGAGVNAGRRFGPKLNLSQVRLKGGKGSGSGGWLRWRCAFPCNGQCPPQLRVGDRSDSRERSRGRYPS